MKKKKLLFAIMTMASLACHAVVDGRYGKAELSATTDGGVVTEKSGQTVLTARKDGNDDSYKVKQTFKLQSGERIYGLGQLQNGNWNQRNRSYDYMIEGNTPVWIPYLHSTKGYALYWDNPSPTSYKDSSSGMSFESAVGYGVDYFFLLGSTIDGQVATQRMRQLTGQMPMIPLWAYGFFQSKERSLDKRMGKFRIQHQALRLLQGAQPTDEAGRQYHDRHLSEQRGCGYL